ncbi:hypothetical protein, partial [Bifidobacterium longum]|uniref:hypothetical protein n=1 Tax=Bifidobacterium longum TaxID=216816 RepID=UPI00207300E4
GRRRRRLRGRVRHQERLGRTISLTHRHAIDTHDKTHFSLLNPTFGIPARYGTGIDWNEFHTRVEWQSND